VPAPPSPKQKFESGFSLSPLLRRDMSNFRALTSFPRSRITGLKPCPISVIAAKSPAGPAPTIITGGLWPTSEYWGMLIFSATGKCSPTKISTFNLKKTLCLASIERFIGLM
jgi:hypothetical protein